MALLPIPEAPDTGAQERGGSALETREHRAACGRASMATPPDRAARARVAGTSSGGLPAGLLKVVGLRIKARRGAAIPASRYPGHRVLEARLPTAPVAAVVVPPLRPELNHLGHRTSSRIAEGETTGLILAVIGPGKPEQTDS